VNEGNANTVKLSETAGLDPNVLPYFVTDSAGSRVMVAFAPLTAADKSELSGTDWLGSVFREAWMDFCGVPPTLKLIEREERAPILGLLRPGNVPEGGYLLERSLLETAPALRFRSGSVSPLRGVGRVLLARLVVESYNQSAGGGLYIVVRPAANGFYDALGLLASPKSPGIYRLREPEADAFFEKATL
jgi:hypothetical protein